MRQIQAIQGLISLDQQERTPVSSRGMLLTIVTTVLEALHAASHRGFQLSPADLERVPDIVENELQSLYLLRGDGEELEKTVPPRVE